MRRALVIMGPAGAGKSAVGAALATRLQIPFVEGDAFHPPGNVARMAAGIPLTDDDRRGWLLTLADQLRTARDADASLVMSCSALRARYRDTLRLGDASVQFVFLDAPPALLHERVAARTEHFMPATLIASQLDALEVPAAYEGAWTFDARDSITSIVDGILARLAARRAASRP